MKQPYEAVITALALLDEQLESNVPMLAEEVTVGEHTWDWANGNTYVVSSDVAIYMRINIEGSVTLRLNDGCTLDAKRGIHVAEGSSLTIEGQTAGTGKLIVTGENQGAGIGGNQDETSSDIITINGGDGSPTIPENGTIKTEDGTKITLPNGGEVSGGSIVVPDGDTVQVGNAPAIIITPPSGGIADPDTGEVTFHVHTVTFDSQGGSDVSSQTVTAGGKAVRPTDPIRNGYTFSGWYMEQSGVNAWDFSSPVTGNMTLYAGWNRNASEEPSGRPSVSGVVHPDYAPTARKPREDSVSDTGETKPRPLKQFGAIHTGMYLKRNGIIMRYSL